MSSWKPRLPAKSTSAVFGWAGRSGQLESALILQNAAVSATLEAPEAGGREVRPYGTKSGEAGRYVRSDISGEAPQGEPREGSHHFESLPLGMSGVAEGLGE
jgi:hypothetical protein